MNKRLYIASPLFNPIERSFNADLKNRLSTFYDIYLPQEDGLLLVDLIAEGELPSDAAGRVFMLDSEALEWCDILLIVLDGRTVPS
jgi:nucleoside 2-deoxyribosyltransferase